MADETVRDPGGDGDALREAAEHDVQRAREDPGSAGLRMIHRSMVALRSLVDRNEMPNPRDVEYLRALYESLEAIAVNGEDANVALHIKPLHRPEDPNKPMEQLLLFIEVGRELDRLKAKGEARSDAPVKRAVETIAKRNGVPRGRVQAAWKRFDAADGWEKWLLLEAEDALKEK